METPVLLRVDTLRWPLVVLTHIDSPTTPELAAHLREIEDEVLARDAPFVQIIDQSRAQVPDAVQRALIAEHQQRMEDAYRRNCLGEAYVVSTRNRGAMVAVFWLAKPPYPYVFLDTMREATEWAAARLATVKSGG